MNRWLQVTVLCVGALGVTAGPAAAQFDEGAREPIPRLRGTVFMGGGGTLPDAVWSAFAIMAKSDGAQSAIVELVVGATPESADFAERTPAPKVVTVASEAADDPGPGGRSGGVGPGPGRVAAGPGPGGGS